MGAKSYRQGRRDLAFALSGAPNLLDELVARLDGLSMAEAEPIGQPPADADHETVDEADIPDPGQSLEVLDPQLARRLGLAVQSARADDNPGVALADQLLALDLPVHLIDQVRRALLLDPASASACADLSAAMRRIERARTTLVEAHQRFVLWIAWRYQNRGLDLLDLVQEGNIGLIKAIEKFDPARGAAFTTYATWWVRQAISPGKPISPRSARRPRTARQAEIVRDIFRRYLDGDSTKAVAVGLEAAGVRSKAWTTRTGRPMGGFVIGKGAIVHILQSRLYLGEIVHKELVHPGEHEAIISRETFDAVAASMAAKAAQRRDRPTRAVSGPLTGLIFDGVGQAMSPSFAYGKGGKLYRYYIAMALQTGANLAPGDDSLRRVSAPAVERFLVETLKRLGGRADIEAADLKGAMQRVELRTTETHLVIDREAVFPGEHPELALMALRKRLREGEQAVAERGAVGAIRLVIPHRLQLRGGRTATWGGSEDYRHGRRLSTTARSAGWR
jgi:hypothetical protein